MKINRIALSAMIASACISGSAFGQTSRTAAPRYAPASYYSYYDEASPNAASKTASNGVVQASANCDTGKACDNSAACDASNAGGAGACDSGSGLGGALGGRLGSGLGQGCDGGGILGNSSRSLSLASTSAAGQASDTTPTLIL